MKKIMVSIAGFFVILLTSNAQTSNEVLRFRIQNFPKKHRDLIQLFRFYGNDFTLIDSSGWINSDTIIEFRPRQITTGLYAFRFKSAKQNQAELILNQAEFSSMLLEADYTQLKNGEIAISGSSENIAYTNLIAIKKHFDPLFYEMGVKISGLSVFNPHFKTRLTEIEKDIEFLHADFNEKLASVVKMLPKTYTSEILVPLAKIPLRKELPDGAGYDGFRAFLHSNFFHYVNTNDTRLLYHYAFIDKVQEYLAEYTDKTTDGSKAGIDILFGSLKSNEEVNSFVYNYLLKVFIQYKSEHLVKYLVEHHPSGCSLNLPIEDLAKLTAITSTQVGSKVPDVLQYDNTGKVQSLYEYCKKNKLTVLVFWVSWCSRCQRELPEMERVYLRYKKQGLGFFTISLDENKEGWTAAIEKYKLSGVNVSELVSIKQSKIPPLYNISTTPSVFILDKESRILAKNILGNQFEEFIRQQLSK